MILTMKITVFGGSGFLGSHVCDKLSDAGHEVTNFDIKQSPWLRSDQQEVVGDIIRQGGVRKGANMGILNCDHPDILEFLDAKVVAVVFAVTVPALSVEVIRLEVSNVPLESLIKITLLVVS